MLKYIRFETKEFAVFPQHMNHSDAAKASRFAVVSAGFVCVSDGVMRCIGGSTSLGIESMPGDSDALADWLAQVEGC
jgi:hypothetical protein